MRKAVNLVLVLVAIAICAAPLITRDTSQSGSLENQLGAVSLRIVLVSSVLLLVLSLWAGIIGKRQRKKSAARIFGMMFAVIISVTLYLITSTIYLNTVSYTKGPVHWHADFEIWRCGQPVLSHNAGDEVDQLRNPHGFLSNKIGSPTIHEHNDRRMHIEGVLMERHEASLGVFFEKIGGELRKDRFTFPTNEGEQTYENGDMCKSGRGEVQVFVYTVKDKQLIQSKLDDPAGYVISAQSGVPPGDCVIFEFDIPKAKTDKVCLAYQVAEKTGKVKI